MTVKLNPDVKLVPLYEIGARFAVGPDGGLALLGAPRSGQNEPTRIAWLPLSGESAGSIQFWTSQDGDDTPMGLPIDFDRFEVEILGGALSAHASTIRPGHVVAFDQGLYLMGTPPRQTGMTHLGFDKGDLARLVNGNVIAWSSWRVRGYKGDAVVFDVGTA